MSEDRCDVLCLDLPLAERLRQDGWISTSHTGLRAALVP